MPPKSLYPKVPITEARQVADTIAQKGAGQPMRRLDVFHELGKSPDSGPSRTLITASGGYGLTTGSYRAEKLALTPLGRRLTIDGESAVVIDGVLNVEIFKKFFDKYRNISVPSAVAAKSFLAEEGVPLDKTNACWSMILKNGRDTGLIESVSGSERVLAPEHAVERKFRESGKAPSPKEAMPARKGAEARGGDDGKGRPPSVLPSININLEIHLPADAKPEVYDAIFASMRKHLVDVG